jgi:hypothetical protein
MSLVINKTKPEISKNAEDDVINVCERCTRCFIAKYWDDELDWYIELNVTNLCRQCQKSDQGS